MLAVGFISANKATLKSTLESGKSIVLVAGGAAEALKAEPDTMKLYLQKRKGFVRLALETSKPLIPCIGFGENEIFHTLVTTKADELYGMHVSYVRYARISYLAWIRGGHVHIHSTLSSSKPLLIY